MKIAQLAPLWEMTPPKTYGGTELVVYNLVQEFLSKGHDVTLFTTGDSHIDIPEGTTGTLEIVTTQPVSLRAKGVRMTEDNEYAALADNEMMLEVVRRANDFDIIHNHMGFQFLPWSEMTQTPTVTTLHGVFKPHTPDYLLRHPYHPLVSISHYQRTPCPELNYVGNVYHGLALERILPRFDTPISGDDSYLVFLGRLSPEKGPKSAIDIAKATGRKLIMAGKVDCYDQKYFNEEIKPHIDGEQITYIGEVNFEEKSELLRNAAATLCPIHWPEPFGLVIAESMACGTPVMALKNGSVPEIVDKGLTGFYADSVDELIDAVNNLAYFDRKRIREHVDLRFSRSRMADDYITIFKKLCQEHRLRKAPPRLFNLTTTFATGDKNPKTLLSR